MKISSIIVSVPSFGDSFFMRLFQNVFIYQMKFPSPHSGILFL